MTIDAMLGGLFDSLDFRKTGALSSNEFRLLLETVQCYVDAQRWPQVRQRLGRVANDVRGLTEEGAEALVPKEMFVRLLAPCAVSCPVFENLPFQAAIRAVARRQELNRITALGHQLDRSYAVESERAGRRVTRVGHRPRGPNKSHRRTLRPTLALGSASCPELRRASIFHQEAASARVAGGWRMVVHAEPVKSKRISHYPHYTPDSLPTSPLSTSRPLSASPVTSRQFAPSRPI